MELDRLIKETLKSVVIDTGGRFYSAQLDAPAIGLVYNAFLPTWRIRFDGISFPVLKSAKWVEECRLDFSEAELEKISTIKVYQKR